MQRLGFYLIFFAIGSAILSMTNYQFRLMMWMDQMGSGAWVVRALMLAVGAVMVFGGAFANQPTSQAAPAHPSPRRQF